MKITERDGWAVLRTDSARINNRPAQCLTFHHLHSDESWALVLAASYESGVMLAYTLMWLRSGEDDYALEAPSELAEKFAAEIAGFAAWLRLTGMWPEPAHGVGLLDD